MTQCGKDTARRHADACGTTAQAAMRWVVFNQKGGVGKSTIVCNLAAVSVKRGRRTLVVDLDPEANASYYLIGKSAADVVNQFQSRARLPQLLADELRQEGLPILEPYLTSSVKVRESHQSARPLPFLAARHKLSARFEELFQALER